MRKQIVSFFALVVMVLGITSAVPAMDRTQHLYGLNPPSTWLNMEQRDVRIGFGTLAWDLFGYSSTYAGQYANCTVSPVTGLNVAVAPTASFTNCAVYQLLAEETTGYGGYPSGVGTFLPADTTQVVLQGILPAGTTTANIGPMGVGASSGQSISNLIECKVVTSDTTSQTVNIVSSGGSVSSVAANRDRVDRLSCQFKSSSSAVTPTTPTVDSGYVAIATVVVPFGTSTVTTGMITAQTGQEFLGFLQPSSPGATAIDTSSNAQTKSGALAVNGGLSANVLAVGGAATQAVGDGGFARSTVSGCTDYGGAVDFGQFCFGTSNTDTYTFYTHSGSTQLDASIGSYGVAAHYSGTTTLGSVPPVYNASGAAVGATVHGVADFCTFAGASTCTKSFTGASVFSSQNYGCVAANVTGPTYFDVIANGSSAVINVRGGGNYTGSVSFACWGT